MIKEVMDNALYENFVNPFLCRDLKEAGLHATSSFEWIIKPDDSIELLTVLFDNDNYYRDTWNTIHHLQKHILYPAFSIKDMEKCLPDWFMSRDHTGYTVAIDKNYNISPYHSERMPDALALVLQQCIRKSMVDLKRLNWLLLSPDV